MVLCLALLLLMTGGNLFADSYIRGDVNESGFVDIDDVTHMVAFIFTGGSAPDPLASGNVNCIDQIDIDDIVYLIHFIFAGGPEPCPAWNPSGELLSTTGCKMFDSGQRDDSLAFQDCIEYDYDGAGYLALRHISAGFNCCPAIAVDIQVEGSMIIIEDIELADSCDCLCLFDLDYEIQDLEPGYYTISVIEPYAPEPYEPLIFEVDLTEVTSGRYCIYRDHYPWGM
jgi:hypothetical protein